VNTLILALIVALSSLVPGNAADGRAQAQWPLRPQPLVVAGFVQPSGPFSPGHRGVDLLGSPGQPVFATLPGTVAFAGPLAGRGVVVIDHGGFRTTYEPVKAAVKRGDVVAGGSVIGSLETALSHCFPRSCLHWGLIRGSAYEDPLTLLGAAPVRLLPLGSATWATTSRHARIRPGGAPAGTRCAAARW
jgi:murein DD-endopeptidase MepM/ murein hydrolase activator NlpD